MNERTYRISVVSDASWSLYRGRRVPFLGAAKRMAEYDAELIKPALLYGEHVTLHTGNVFLAAQVEDFAARTTMPPQALTFFLNIHRFDRATLEAAGIRSSELPDKRSIEEFVNAAPKDIGDWLETGFEVWGDQIAVVLGKLREALLASIPDYESPELSPALDAGILTVKGHTEDAPATASIIFTSAKKMVEEPREYQLRAAAEVALRIAQSDDSVLLDSWAHELLRALGIRPEKRMRQKGSDLGTRILASIPSIRNASISEILDVRQELAAPLVRFRSAVTKAVREFSAEDDDPPIDVFWDEEISPALVEIEELVKENSFLRNVLDVVQKPRDLAPGAAGLALGFGGGNALIGAVGGGFGLAWPVLRALYEKQKRNRAIAAHRFYLLYRLKSKP
jgi:hypothetical protein